MPPCASKSANIPCHSASRLSGYSNTSNVATAREPPVCPSIRAYNFTRSRAGRASLDGHSILQRAVICVRSSKSSLGETWQSLRSGAARLPEVLCIKSAHKVICVPNGAVTLISNSIGAPTSRYNGSLTGRASAPPLPRHCTVTVGASAPHARHPPAPQSHIASNKRIVFMSGSADLPQPGIRGVRHPGAGVSSKSGWRSLSHPLLRSPAARYMFPPPPASCRSTAR